LWAKLLINEAQKWVFTHKKHIHVESDHFSQKIIKGFLTGTPSFGAFIGAGEGECT